MPKKINKNCELSIFLWLQRITMKTSFAMESATMADQTNDEVKLSEIIITDTKIKDNKDKAGW